MQREARPPLRLAAEDQKAVREALTESLELLGLIPDLPDANREYIADLLKSCLALLDGESPDFFAARMKFHQAVGAVAFQPGIVDTAEGKSFIAKLRTAGTVWVFSNIGVPVVTGLASNVGAVMALEALAKGS